MSIQKREITTIFWPCTLLLCWMLLGAEAVRASEEFEQYLAEGREFLEKQEFKKACKAFKVANELAGGEAEEPLLGLAMAHYRLAEYQKTIDITESLARHAREKQILVNAYNLLGVSLFMRAPKDTERLEKAANALRHVIDLVGGDAIEPRLSLAYVLQALNREHEAAENLRAILDAKSASNLALADSTRIQVCRIRSSLEKFLPEGGAPTRQEREEPIYVGGDVQAPEKVFFPQPQYSEAARKDRIQGVVIVKTIINKMGCVTNINVLKGLDHDLNEQAVRAMSNWVFKPATLGGKPVAVYYNLTINFRLQ